MFNPQLLGFAVTPAAASFNLKRHQRVSFARTAKIPRCRIPLRHYPVVQPWTKTPKFANRLSGSWFTLSEGDPFQNWRGGGTVGSDWAGKLKGPTSWEVWCACSNLLLIQSTSDTTTLIAGNFFMAGKLVGRNEKCALRRIFACFLAEWTSYASKPNQLQQAPLHPEIHLKNLV